MLLQSLENATRGELNKVVNNFIQHIFVVCPTSFRVQTLPVANLEQPTIVYDTKFVVFTDINIMYIVIKYFPHAGNFLNVKWLLLILLTFKTFISFRSKKYTQFWI